MLFKFLFGRSIARLLMSAQDYKKELCDYPTTGPGISPNGSKTFFKKIEIAFFTIPVPSSTATIHYCDLRHVASCPKDPKDQKVIICASSGNTCHELSLPAILFPALHNEGKRLEVTPTDNYVDLASDYPSYRIIGMNFRGVMQSTGRARSEQDWVNDVLALVAHLRSQGVPLENIVLKGHSLGGALFTLAAAQLYKKERRTTPLGQKIPCMKLINDRSFSSLADWLFTTPYFCNLLFLIPAILLLYAIIPFALFGLKWGSLLSLTLLGVSIWQAPYPCTLAQILLQPTCTLFLKISFGTLNAAKAYRSLPKEAVAYLFVRADEIIPYEASLHQAVKPLYRAYKKEAQGDFSRLLALKDSKLGYFPTPGSLQNPVLHTLPLYSLKTSHKLRKNQAGGSTKKTISGATVLRNILGRLLSKSSPPTIATREPPPPYRP